MIEFLVGLPLVLVIVIVAACCWPADQSKEVATLRRQVQLLTAERDSLIENRETGYQALDATLQENHRLAIFMAGIKAEMDRYENAN